MRRTITTVQRRNVGDHGHDQVRVVVETTDEALALSDFRRYRDAGLDVTVCGGPVGDERCPLVEGGGCAPAGQADVVLFGLGVPGDILAAHRAQHPSVPVVVEVRRDDAPPADVDGCTVLPFPSSVDEQIRVLHRAARRFEQSSRIG
jgi:hypothetical protein